MSEEVKAFALQQATEAKDVVAEELFRRANRVDLEMLNNEEWENIVFYFNFNGAEVPCKWNKDDRFSDPDVVYDILVQLLFQAEDAPVKAPIKEVEEPMGLVFGDNFDEELEMNPALARELEDMYGSDS